MDYDDTDFLQKMFSNVDSETREYKLNNINVKNNKKTVSSAKGSQKELTIVNDDYESKNGSPEIANRGRQPTIEIKDSKRGVRE